MPSLPFSAIQAVMFDLDGTLIDSTETYFQIVAEVLGRLGLPPVDRQQILGAVVNGEFQWQQVLPVQADQPPMAVARQAWKLALEIYPEVFKRQAVLIPGALETVRQISAAGLKIGVVTSTLKRNLAEKLALLEKSGVLDHIQTLIGADDAPRKKPFPDPLLLCAGRLAVDLPACLYVGDTRLDIQAGRAAGTKTAAVLTGLDGREALLEEAPDAILESVADLGCILKDL
jgi:phosphoglycolate phosphatase